MPNNPSSLIIDTAQLSVLPVVGLDMHVKNRDYSMAPTKKGRLTGMKERERKEVPWARAYLPLTLDLRPDH